MIKFFEQSPRNSLRKVIVEAKCSFGTKKYKKAKEFLWELFFDEFIDWKCFAYRQSPGGSLAPNLIQR